MDQSTRPRLAKGQRVYTIAWWLGDTKVSEVRFGSSSIAYVLSYAELVMREGADETAAMMWHADRFTIEAVR